MDKDYLADRFGGCLLGMAMGDAMGAPADGLPAFLVAKRFQQVDGFFGPSSKIGRYGFAASLALTLGAHVVEEGGLCPAAVVRAHLAAMPRLPPPWPDVVSQLNGKRLEECGCQASMEAWSALKMVPVGLWASLRGLEDADLLRACRLACRPTHPGRACAVAGFVVAKVIKDCVRLGPDLNQTGELYYQPKSLLSRLVDACDAAESVMSPEERREDRMSWRLCHARSALQGEFCRTRLRRPMMLAEFAGMHGHSRDVHDAVGFSLFCFMRQPDDWAATVDAASMGGLASVNAALVGAMSGAFHGLSLLPKDTRDALENSGKILGLAERMAAMPQG